MPVSYEIRAQDGLVIARYTGEVTVAQVMSCFRAFQADPGFSYGLTHLVDVAQVHSAEAGFAEIFALFSTYSRTYAAAGQVMRVAIYSPGDFAYGLARIFENLSETSDVVDTGVFQSFDQALDWARPPRSVNVE